jgi:hypothetical protein
MTNAQSFTAIPAASYKNLVTAGYGKQRAFASRPIFFSSTNKVNGIVRKLTSKACEFEKTDKKIVRRAVYW